MIRLNATMALVVALCALLISCAQPSSLTSGTSSTTLTLSSISPSEADAGGGSLTLTAAGGSFGSASMVMWNGSSRATTVVNSTTLSAAISSADLTNEGDVTVAVKDVKTGATTNALHFTIHPKKKAPAPLSVTTASLAGATTGTAYQASLAATGGTTPYAWSIASGQLPSGLSLSSAGVISGNPNATGTFSFTVQVRDSASSPQTATKLLSINVVAATQPPAPISITTTTLAGATAGTAYSANLAATGGTAPYAWSVTSGALPAGLSLSSAGVISGTPTTGGTTGYFTVSAKDSATSPQAATQALSISVASAAGGVTPPPQASGYSLKFSDEFDTLNMSPNGNGSGYNWYNPGIFWNSPAPYSNITDANSILHLNWTPGQGTSDTSLSTASQNGANYRAWRYGYFEVRMRWNAVTGAWPAIWMIPTAGYSGANEQGELDIFEGQGAYPHTYYGTIHHWLNKQSVGSNSNNTYNLGSNVDFTQWHTYGCLWTPGQVTWYFDNQPLMSASTYSIFDQQNYYLIIGSQEGANWSYGNMSGVTASSIWMDVDWVRVWQK